MFQQFRKEQKAERPRPAPLAAITKAPEPDRFAEQDPRSTFWLDLKTRLHERLLDMLNLSAIDKVAPSDLRREVSVG
jgi:pilus assembly protein CpaF